MDGQFCLENMEHMKVASAEWQKWQLCKAQRVDSEVDLLLSLIISRSAMFVCRRPGPSN